jgi:phenylalanyl-tRNA synthetase beta subunit
MRRQVLACAIATALFMTASPSQAASSVKSSKSNTSERLLVYSASLMTPAQAAAAVAELDKQSRGAKLDDEMVRGILKQQGVAVEKVKKIIVRQPDKARKDISVIVLSDLADEPQALAVSDEGASGQKTKKKE